MKWQVSSKKVIILKWRMSYQLFGWTSYGKDAQSCRTGRRICAFWWNWICSHEQISILVCLFQVSCDSQRTLFRNTQIWFIRVNNKHIHFLFNSPLFRAQEIVLNENKEDNSIDTHLFLWLTIFLIRTKRILYCKVLNQNKAEYYFIFLYLYLHIFLICIKPS